MLKAGMTNSIVIVEFYYDNDEETVYCRSMYIWLILDLLDKVNIVTCLSSWLEFFFFFFFLNFYVFGWIDLLKYY